MNGEYSSSASNPSASDVRISGDKDERKNLSPYEKILFDLKYDARFKAEETNGRRIGFYRIFKDIGLGNFSRVKLGRHLLAHEKVAIKILDKTKIDEKTQRLLLREITSMKRLYHPNIIRLYEVIETPKEIHIVTEYASGGDLYTRINHAGKIPEDEAKHIFAQITAAIDHMHSRDIVHRDIKTENVFFAKERLIKLGDLGFSTFTERNQTLTTFCGSPPYAAPELYRDDNYIGIYVDIWAMGITLFFMVTGLMPFRAENIGKLKQSIIDGHYSIPGHVSNQCQELIHGLLNHEIRERWSINRIRSCAWLTHQSFPKEFEPFSMNLNEQCTSSNENKRSPIENEAYLRLKQLGITYEHLQAMSETSAENHLSHRDNINGTYKILLHRLQKQSTALERDPLYGKQSHEDFSSSGNHKISWSIDTSEQKPIQNLHQTQTQKARVCIIL
ncbi:unnamed protein product [Rotaria magnacalcarata]|uniref:non-specific serine/threonine protein kinase n=1 Tax=Rotaria magnacalcarata TaxID=392030 RepID=A0A819AAY3_9BILA|nr:unnamed protein product [Rotaria magnacalcarata]CAF2122428.1 unnamed protein product [Rotaria magnacalcarata]CAF3738523.1 unnamed protein product [Rotaria magnacalcarata]CAF3775017.1 unnamed protein product [Rotaria magnacalcarata]